LRIQLTATKNQSQTVSRFFFYDDADTVRDYNFEAPPVISGNYSMSIISIGTAFIESDETTFENSTFKKLQDEQSRAIISKRLGNRNINSGDSTLGEFAEGYGANSQEVLLYSFLAAYTDKSTSSIDIRDITKHIPVPNWNITYDGLSRIEFFKRYFRTVTLSHNYRSTFSVGSYTRNPKYKENGGDPSQKDAQGNFIAEKQMSTASISEQFSPLINIDFTWKNGLLTRLEVRRDRNISMSFANNQVTEVQGKEYILGLGYRLTNLRLPFKVGKLERTSDLDLRADFSIRDNQTIIRRVVENRNELTAGQRIFSIKFTADYRLSTKLNIQLYYDRVANTPLISTTFPTANTNAGIRLRFTLSQ
jgi:cell surface protein SprA